MEFKFGAIDNQPSTHRSSSSSSISYFAEQAIRVGYSSTDTGRPLELVGNPMRNPINMGEPIRREFDKEQDFFRNPMDIHKAMQREIEKQRIREEIEAEIARKQILEEEVRRELLMERELRMRRSDGFFLNHSESKSLEGRLALSFERRLGYSVHTESGGVEMVPFQRNAGPKITEIKPLSEVSKEKVILLPKPDSNLCGTKRKALTSPTVGLAEPSSIAPKKKLKEDWICSICEISTTSDLALTEHLKGKKHKAKEARLKEQSAGQNIGLGVDRMVKLLPKKDPGLGFSGKNENVGDSSAKIGEKTGEDSKKNTMKFWCEMCNVGAHSGKVMNRHKKGKKHLYRLECNKNRSALTVTGGLENCGESIRNGISEAKADEV